MDNHAPSAKRIKLSLEPGIEQPAVDITNSGHEIYKTEQSLPEKLMQNVDRIWMERGDWRDLSESDLKKSIESKDTEEDQIKTHENESDPPTQPTAAPTPGFDIVKLRESVLNKLFHAKSEIDVALDVINILATQSRPGAAVKDLVLPPGSLTATYVSKPKTTLKAQLEAVQLTLGLKRKQQKTASAYLKASASNLRKLVENENSFWEEALDLRRNHWLMQANSSHSTLGNAGAGPTYLVQYGFTDVGSDFNESSLGDLDRASTTDNEEGSAKMALSLPHSEPKKVVVYVSQRQMGSLGLNFDVFSEGILGMTTDPRSQSQKNSAGPFAFHSPSNKIQKQLLDAQATIFDAELFADILSEAQTFNSDIRMADDEMILTIGGQIDVSIKKVPGSTLTTEPKVERMTTQQMAGQTIELCLRLMLIQRHRFNIWKSRARILSSSRKVQHLLASIGEPSSVGTTAGVINPASHSANSVAPAAVTATTASAAGNPNASAGTSNSSATRSGRSQQAGLATSQRPNTRETLPEIPILSPVLSMSKFWVLFDRLRHVVYDIIDPLCGEGGIGLTVHFKTQNVLLQPKTNVNRTSYDIYPSYGDMGFCLTVSFLKGPSLQFILSQQGIITVVMPQNTVVLTQVSEFEALLLREITLMCLEIVCEECNAVICQSTPYLDSDSSSKLMFGWKVDEVEETIHGYVWWATQSKNSKDSHTWRAVQVRMVKTCVSGEMKSKPAYSLQFRMDPLVPTTTHQGAPKLVQSVMLARSFSQTEPNSQGCSLTFRERVRRLAISIIEMGYPENVPPK
ncbi:subunit 17 of mediator complex-domain-containing protein [Phycomyces nitens]|nr:subunit 17 of mediator complex-domain-containing protein [Phycomyces nitens]